VEAELAGLRDRDGRDDDPDRGRDEGDDEGDDGQRVRLRVLDRALRCGGGGGLRHGVFLSRPLFRPFDGGRTGARADRDSVVHPGVRRKRPLRSTSESLPWTSVARHRLARARPSGGWIHRSCEDAAVRVHLDVLVLEQNSEGTHRAPARRAPTGGGRVSDEATTGPGFLRTLSHSVPRSYRLVAARRGRPRLLRSFVTGALATGLAAAVLFTASASVPGSGPAGAPGEPPIRLYGSIENVRVGETGAVPEGVTLAQVVAVLERAERMAQEQGAAFSPTVAQAAAELGMLYTTYQMQQLAFGRNNEGLRVEDAPERRDAVADENGAGGGKGDGDHADDGGGDDPDGPSKVPGGREDDESEPDGTAPAIEVSRGHGSVIDPRTDDRPAADTGHDDASGYAAGYVTYDQVVMAAVRLANMLDPSVPNALVEVEGITREGFSLRESLLDVVDTFGGSTAGYANGRIPVDVLCPLEFAPGHILRCDAAERLTALSAEFEKEFGYPIPMTDSYRSYEMQVTLKGIKPHLAAIPGTSNHGWGLAVDLGNPIAGGHSPEFVWLRVHGPDYGWDNPSWARLDGAKPEPWHFEFFAAGSIPNRAVDPSDVGTWTP